MTHRGPFQPLLFCDSVTWNNKPGAQVPWCWVSVVPVRWAAALAGAARNARPELAWRSSETFTGRAPSNPQASDAGLKHRARTRGRALLPPKPPRATREERAGVYSHLGSPAMPVQALDHPEPALLAPTPRSPARDDPGWGNRAFRQQNQL